MPMFSSVVFNLALLICFKANAFLYPLVTREAWIAIESIDRNILELERVVGREFGVQVLDNFVQKITDACGKLTPLQRRRSKKTK